MPFGYTLSAPIAMQDKSTIPWGYALPATVAALQKCIDRDFAPRWRGVRADLNIVPAGLPMPTGSCQLFLLDTAKEPGAEGYHELTPDGFPIMYVGVKDTLDAGDKVPVTLCHEVLEGLIDPFINASIEAPDGTEFAAEVCDAVEADEYDIDGIPMSNFQLPAWFEGFRQAGQGPFDFLELCTHPFEIRKGGYMPVKKRRGWTQVFGSKAAKQHHKKRGRRRLTLRQMSGRFCGPLHAELHATFHREQMKHYVK